MNTQNRNEETAPQAPQLFADRSGEIMAMNDAAAVARATQEIQAALVVAKRFPRDEVKARAKILLACSRIGLAGLAEYEYSRGGTKITGPTIDLLRAIASRWGNIRWGWTETDRRVDQGGVGMSSVRCWAWDMESNSPAERTFFQRHWRDTQGGGYQLEDDRDIYELIANQAARRVRACLEEVIDSDIVQDAIDKCRETLRKGAGSVPLIDRVVNMVAAFAEFGVTKDQVELRLGNKCESCSENQLASLRRIWKSLKDGVGQPADFFKPVATARPDLGTATANPAPTTAEPHPTAPTTLPPNDEEEEAAAGLAPQTAPAAPAPAAPTAEPKERRTRKRAEPAPPAATPESKVLQIRSMMNRDGINELELFDFLTSIDSTGGTDNLDDLAQRYPAGLTMIANQWTDVAERIKQSRQP